MGDKVDLRESRKERIRNGECSDDGETKKRLILETFVSGMDKI